MPSVARDDLTFIIEDGYLVASNEAGVIDRVPIARAELFHSRWNIIVPSLHMNANFSEEEWASMQGVEAAPVEDAEATPVVETTSRRRRK